MRCYVPGCGNKYKTGANRESYHLWTKDPAQQQLWKDTFGMSYVPTKHARICSVHFDSDDFKFNAASTLKRIKLSAVPKHKLGPRTYAPVRSKNYESDNIGNESRERVIETSITNIDRKMCRVCSRISRDTLELFDKGEVTMAGQRLSRLVQFDICPEDGLPQIICYSCNVRLDQFVEFQHSATTMHFKFLKAIRNTKSSTARPLLQSVISQPPAAEFWDDNNEMVEEHLDVIKNVDRKMVEEEDHMLKVYCEQTPNAMPSENYTESAEPNRTIITPYTTLHVTHIPEVEPIDTPTARRAHQKRKRNDRIVGCPICNKDLKIVSLAMHIKRHTTDRLAKCELCSKSFKTDEDLKHHQRIHRTDRGIVCDICNGVYLTNSGYNAHIRTHGTNYCVPCTDRRCRRTFSNRILMREHRERVHGKTFSCKLCKVEYHTKIELQNHLRSPDHSGTIIKAEIPFIGVEQVDEYPITMTIKEEDIFLEDEQFS